MTYAPPPTLAKAAECLDIPDVCYLPAFLPVPTADELFASALADAAWRRERFMLFGREVKAPRLTLSYGEAGTAYRYSGVDRPALPWPPAIDKLARDVAAAVGWRFNYVLMNRYRDGRDRLGWHADDEPDLGAMPVIATISVGAVRTLRIRHRRGGGSLGRTLAHGSLLLMWGCSQRDYKHCLVRTKKPVGERISFTFRYVSRPATALASEGGDCGERLRVERGAFVP